MSKAKIAVGLFAVVATAAVLLPAIQKSPTLKTMAGAPAATSATGDPSPSVTGLTRPADATGPLSVVRVVDGDTVRLLVDGTEQPVRLIGVDTPETKDPNEPVQCFGEQAAARTHELLDGAVVWVETDPTQGATDRYGRTLAYVWLDETTLVNEVLIRDGFAHEYTYDTPYAYRDVFLAQQQAAQSAALGFWSPDTCAGDTTQAAQR